MWAKSQSLYIFIKLKKFIVKVITTNNGLILIISLFATLLLSWSKFQMLAFNDWEIPFTIINLDNYLNHVFAGWTYNNLGAQTPFTHLKLSYISFVFLLRTLRVPVFLIEFILILSPFVLANYGMNKLLAYIFPSKNPTYTFFGGIVYTLSLPFLFVFGMFGPPYIVTYAALPIMLYQILKTYDSVALTSKIVNGMKSSILIFVFAVNANISLPISIFFFLVLFLSLDLFLDPDRKNKIIGYAQSSSAILFFTILFLAPFILENISYLIYSAGYLTDFVEAFPKSWYINNSLWEIFRLGGFFSWYQIIGNDRFIPYTFDFKNTPNLLSSFSIVIFSLFSLFWQKKESVAKSKSCVLILTLIFLINIVPINGLQEPFASVNTFLFKNVPFFLMFRQAYTKLGVINAFIVAVLFFYSLVSTIEYLKNNAILKKILIFLVVAIVVYNALPMLRESPMKTVYSDPKWNTPSNIEEAINKINDETNDVSVLIIPTSEYPLYSWGYLGSNFYPYFSNKRVVFSASLYTKAREQIESIYDSLTSDNPDISLLAKNNIGYIYYQKDLSRSWNPYRNTEKFYGLKTSNDSVGYSVILNNDNVTIYKVDSSLVLPLLKIEELDGNQHSDLKFNKTSATRYILNLRKISGLNKLTFLQSFHKGWKLYLEPMASLDSTTGNYRNDKTTRLNENQKVFDESELTYAYRSPIFENTHHYANNYANGWMIDPTYIKKNYPKEYYKENPDGSIDIKIVLYFKPQSYFYLGLIISGLTFIGCIVYLLWDWRNRRSKLQVEGVL